MRSDKEAQERAVQSEYHKQKHGVFTEYPNATEANALLAHSGQISTSGIPTGQPIHAQDQLGNLSFLPGLFAPVKPDASGGS